MFSLQAMCSRRTPSTTTTFRVALFTIPYLFFTVPAVALGQANTQAHLDSAAIAAKVSPAVVLIKGDSGDGIILGSGLIVSSDGKIATNLHVIRDLKSAGVQLASGEIFDAVSVLGFDDRKDLAIVKIAGFDLPSLELGNSNEARIGERVVVIGSPQGLQGTVTTGVVSAMRDEPSGAGFKLIQTDASVNPGNSGGPLLNDRGQAIGIVTWKWRGSEGLNFAVPINYLRGMLEDLHKPMSLDELRTALSSAKTDVFSSSSDYPVFWKSLTSDRVLKFRFVGEYIYGETVLTEERRKVYFDSLELKKDGSGYKGIVRINRECSWTAWAPVVGTYSKDHRCGLEEKIELTTVSPGRIEGRTFGAPRGTKLDCSSCSYSKKPVWTTFVWIPQ